MYSFYFDFEGETIQLPVNPPDLISKIGNKNKVVELLNLGDVNILKDPGLTSVSFNILLPGQLLPFAVYLDGFKEPQYFLDWFEKYKTDKKPVRFTVSRVAPWGEPLFDTNMLVSLETYSIKEKAGEEGDIYVELQLKQYKEYSTQIVTLQSVSSDKPETVQAVQATVQEQRPAKTPAATYTVKAGDTLWAIAKKQLNDGDMYKEIAQVNNIKNPNLIYPGQVLRLG